MADGNDKYRLGVTERARIKLLHTPPIKVNVQYQSLWEAFQLAERGLPSEIVFNSQYPDIISYCELYARMMQVGMVGGKTVTEVASDAAIEAGPDLDHIMDYVRTAAVILITCWEYGEELRKWLDNSHFSFHPGRPTKWVLPIGDAAISFVD